VLLPARPHEFIHRISALLRRAYPERHGAMNIDAGPYHFDVRHQLVTLRGVPVQLSGTQYRLASLFFSNIGRVLSRDHIFAMVWGREFRECTRTIDSHVSRLRLLLEIGSQNDFRLQPVYKSGYRLVQLSSAERQADRRAAQHADPLAERLPDLLASRRGGRAQPRASRRAEPLEESLRIQRAAA
jgi:two-component system, OmpR family, phosphate regulon response regulator PhoB